MFEDHFLTNNPSSFVALASRLKPLLARLERRPDQAYTGLSAAALAALFDCELGGPDPVPEAQLLERLATVIDHSINVNHPNAIAHLHCPATIHAIAAELMIGALNPSMDSFDQAPAATVIELQMVRFLCDLAGFPQASAGAFTPGATQSNLFGLLLAREAAFRTRFERSCWQEGTGEPARSMRIICSEAAHFTVEKSAAQLGLGTNAVVRVACDDSFRMSVPALQQTLSDLHARGCTVIAIVGTAGTTDFGSIDPLGELAEIARSVGAWFHIDAAYGGALLFSGRHRNKLAGIDEADSVSIDFHKLLWQPISCGVFLVRDSNAFEHVRMHADYLNPEEHEQDGVPDLVTRSLLTSRRFDALKPWISLQLLGGRELEAMINRTLELAQEVAAYIEACSQLVLINEPALGCVVFRYSPKDGGDGDRINGEVRRQMFESGEAVLGQTRVRGRTCLKLTCLNPRTTPEQLRSLVDAIIGRGALLENAPGEGSAGSFA